MDVNYFIDIIKQLIEKGLTRKEIADALGLKKQNMTEILGGVPGKQRQNLKDEQLPGLLKLCRQKKVGPQSAAELMRLINQEMGKK